MSIVPTLVGFSKHSQRTVEPLKRLQAVLPTPVIKTLIWLLVFNWILLQVITLVPLA
jgi:hypothetical protein